MYLFCIDDICGKVPNLCAHICENTFDAYKCSCRPGYTLDDNNVTCSLADKEDGDVCPDGYVMDELQGKCVDIDECKENLHKCLSTQYCHNKIGDYQCLTKNDITCQPGYIYNNESSACDGKSVTNSIKTCFIIQSLPPETEICDTGYYLKDSRCADIDECLNNLTNLCKAEVHQECKNTVGSYYCNCLPGYSLDVTQNECVGRCSTLH